ncbi:hypothetical protein D6C81_09009 [Aureobasidium pullulans]|nr:hypothetical protein D6C81_09009 [Aureobasidium pullulans]
MSIAFVGAARQFASSFVPIESLISNLLWVMPWAIVVSKAHITPEDAWTYHSIVFGGSLVFSFFDVLVVDLVWAWALLRGTMRLPAIY